MRYRCVLLALLSAVARDYVLAQNDGQLGEHAQKSGLSASGNGKRFWLK
jgi:hypothetical protein